MGGEEGRWINIVKYMFYYVRLGVWYIVIFIVVNDEVGLGLFEFDLLRV